ncbi:MAG: hypothetical protein JO004_04495 [Methylobacteriaceae bacterium]|nr:hypothetical protein [Methylobacteriaceae bacterium]
MTIRTLSLVFVLVFCAASPAISKGSNVVKDDPWNPDHVANLPAEVRQYIAGICKAPPSAQHDFATI